MLFSPEMQTLQPAPEPGARVADDGELQLGTTERGVAANGVILALSRAARSFLLYDPSNEAIRHFLGALRETVEGYLAAWGELAIVVRPFELVVHGEVVYLDRDRERSLAFRLYRDGVRRLTLQPGLSWHELLKLLEVVSIRYTGVRQAEDDMVVLLWKAGFTRIQVEAVEGFVPEEDGGESGGSAGRQGGRVEAPPDFDLPPPPLGPLGPLRYRPLAASELAAIVEEDGTQALPALCVRLIGELLRAVADPADALTFSEVVPVLREIRDFLLAEGLLAAVLDAVRLLGAARFESAADSADRDALLASFADARALARLVHSAGREERAAPREMIELLERVPGNHLRTILAVLATERGEASRRVARSLIERYIGTDEGWLPEALATIEPPIAVELLRAAAAADPRRGLEAVIAVAARPELEIQLEALQLMERVPLDAAAIDLLLAQAAAPNDDVRVRALEVLGKRRVQPAFTVVLERLKRDAPLRLKPAEAEAAGEALARIDPGAAIEVFRGWIRPKGLLGGILPGHTMLQWAAVSGLVVLPWEEAEGLIRTAAERAGSDLARHCTAAMVRRRRLSRGVDS